MLHTDVILYSTSGADAWMVHPAVSPGLLNNGIKGKKHGICSGEDRWLDMPAGL
jgi:hypothetical protein